jgi:glucosamine--fructose-6-phosphate aminotransferase (isomerizing)
LKRRKILSAFIKDIFSLPETLRRAIDTYPIDSILAIKDMILEEKFDRIILSGMGASMYAVMPVSIHLSGLRIPVYSINAAELYYYTNSQIGNRTLLWLNSQSGKSIEIINLIESFKLNPPKTVIASVNDGNSPLAKAANYSLLINAGHESIVSVKTYCNMLAINLMAALQINGMDIKQLQQQLNMVADQLQQFLEGWESKISLLDGLLGDFRTLFILGRGTSMGSAEYGALVCKESVRCAFDGIHSADFRHGPLELVQPDLSAIMLAGHPLTKQININLAKDIKNYGGQVVWIDSEENKDLPTFKLPFVENWTSPFFEMIVMQLLSVVMARRKGIEPGDSRQINKITTKE